MHSLNHLHTDQRTESGDKYDRCPHCGSPDRGPHHLISAHSTSEGMILWSRCTCGAVEARLERNVIARGRPRFAHDDGRQR